MNSETDLTFKIRKNLNVLKPGKVKITYTIKLMTIFNHLLSKCTHRKYPIAIFKETSEQKEVCLVCLCGKKYECLKSYITAAV